MTRRIFCKVLLVVVAVLGLLALSNVLLAQGNSENAFEHVREVQERNTERLMAMNGVEGTAIGFNPNARLSIHVLLERPGVGGIPQELDGVPVHPVVTGKIYALPKPDKPGKPPKPDPEEPADPTARFPRPVPIGVSTGHPDITAGTIGCRVTDGSNVYALSNNHVYANENSANIGDKVLQPGAYDGGVDTDDAIGTLADFEQIKFNGSPNTIDAAIALCSEGTLSNATPSDGYGMPKSGTTAAYINQPVKKYGRTTRLTKGRVYALNATVNVVYDSGVALFENQIVITPGGFSAGGDSGSLVVVDGKGRNKADDRKPVGLLFAGSDFITIANPIDAVLYRFDAAIDGE
jgi:hypothetical protein